jgi:hypothetical protein
MPLVSTIDHIPVYTTDTDLVDDGQEHGNLAITVTPARLWIWLEVDGWQAVTSTTTVDLARRVARLEALLADIGDILTRED